jgi:hypothetical protein
MFCVLVMAVFSMSDMNLIIDKQIYFVNACHIVIYNLNTKSSMPCPYSRMYTVHAHSMLADRAITTTVVSHSIVRSSRVYFDISHLPSSTTTTTTRQMSSAFPPLQSSSGYLLCTSLANGPSLLKLTLAAFASAAIPTASAL